MKTLLATLLLLGCISGYASDTEEYLCKSRKGSEIKIIDSDMDVRIDVLSDKGDVYFQVLDNFNISVGGVYHKDELTSKRSTIKGSVFNQEIVFWGFAFNKRSKILKLKEKLLVLPSRTIFRAKCIQL